jgi:hypothetical protein
MAALAATLMVAPAAMAHGNFGPTGGQDRGAVIGQGGMMGQGYGEHGKTGYRYGHGGMMGQGQGYGHRGMMGSGQGYGHGGMMGSGQGYGHGGMMGSGQGYGHGGMMGSGQGYGHGGMMGSGQGSGHGGKMGSGQGCGQGGMMGRGMMGQGRGGMMGMAAPLAEDLSIDGVRHIMEHRVAMMQNPNLKVGEIVEQDDDTITADVVTQDGSLVRRFMVDRHTGAMRPAGIDNVEK